MTVSRDNRSEEGEGDALAQGAALRRGRVVVGATGGTGSPAAVETGEARAQDEETDLTKTGKRAGVAAEVGSSEAGGSDGRVSDVERERGSDKPSDPAQRSSNRRGLVGTGYSQVPAKEHGEERVALASIPKAPRLPGTEEAGDGPVAERRPSSGAALGGGAPGGSSHLPRPDAGDSALPRGPRPPGGQGMFDRTILGSTPLKRVEVDPPPGQSPGQSGSSNKTLASAPEGARTLFGGAASPVAERRISSHPPGTGSSAPPPVPGSEGTGEEGPRIPRTLESLRAVTTTTQPVDGSSTMRGLTPVSKSRAPLSGNAFNRTLTGASYVPRGGTFPRRRLQEGPGWGDGPGSSGPPSPMRPAGARIVDSSTSSIPPSPPPPSSDELAAAISDAAAGQLRESELPVPSERLDPGVLRQLGMLDEALKSSPRVPGFREPGSSPPRSPYPRSEEEASRIPSSAFDAPSPGSVPALSALPERLHPQENSSGLPTVGRYEVLARLKSGGMGSVYMCRLSGNAGFRRLFAMKVLHAHLADDREALSAFEREARMLASLHHPNVVGVVDVGSPREPYIVLEYVEGGSLHELFRATTQGRDPRLVVASVLDALEGLRAAHEAVDEEGRRMGMVHCDVCPQNILVGVDGAARLTDFGIAQTSESLRLKHVVRGKPRYIAPERLAGGPFDARADLFSLGAVLYVGLTGVEVFAGEDTAETRRNVARLDPVAPSAVGFHPPPSLDWIVLKALSKDPSGRFQSAEEFAYELRRVAEREALLVPRAKVGAWVKEVLSPSLRARRVAAQRGAGAVRAPGMTDPPPVVAEVDPPAPKAEDTSPISEPLSAAEHTEVIPDDEDGGRSGDSRRGLYVALVLVVAVVAWAVLAPDSLSRLFQVEQDSQQEFEPRERAPKEGVVIPEISAPFDSQNAEGVNPADAGPEEEDTE